MALFLEVVMTPKSKKFSKHAKKIEMSILDELSFFLGVQVSRLKNRIFISQTKYVKEMLKIFNMEDLKSVCTHTITRSKLSKEDEENELDQNIYRSMIGSLLYVTTSRPDINYTSHRFSINISSKTKGNPCPSSKENM